MPIRTRIVKIGNSQGIRIPRSVLSQVELNGEVEIDVQDGRLVLSPARRPRAGWAAAFTAMAQAGDDQMLDGCLPTVWDEQDWEWP